LSAHELAVLIASAKILDELPDFAVAVEEPSTRIALALGFGEQSRDEAFTDAALAAGDQNPPLHAVRSSASKALFSVARAVCDVTTRVAVAGADRVLGALLLVPFVEVAMTAWTACRRLSTLAVIPEALSFLASPVTL
jgi:hypothetical protein